MAVFLSTVGQNNQKPRCKYCAHLLVLSLTLLTPSLLGQWMNRWLFILCFFSILAHSALVAVDNTFASRNVSLSLSYGCLTYTWKGRRLKNRGWRKRNEREGGGRKREGGKENVRRWKKKDVILFRVEISHFMHYSGFMVSYSVELTVIALAP